MTRKELNTHIEKRYSECCKRSQGLSYGSFYDGYVDCYCEQQKQVTELEEKLKHAEENCINKTCVVFKDKEDCVAKLLELEKENAELKADNDARKFAMAMSEKVEKQLREENAELKSENQKWKDEWQEQVQKANDEGYARILQTIQLSKAKDIIKNLMVYVPVDLKEYEEAEQLISEVEK